MENPANSFQILCNGQSLLEIKIDEHRIFRAIATIDKTIHSFAYQRLNNQIYIFTIHQSRTSIYSQLNITNDGNVYLTGNKTNKNGKIPVMQLLGSGDTCGWAPPENYRNNSSEKAPEIPTELQIAEAIYQILTRYSYNVRKSVYDRIVLSHDNSPILSITIDEKPTLYLIPENSLELIFQGFHQNCYIFKNNETYIEIHICILGQIIFQQNGTDIRATFTPQNISELLYIQFFYSIFSDIYKLLFDRFTNKGTWNNNLKITNFYYCLFEFSNNQNISVLKLKIIYDPKNKRYTYSVIINEQLPHDLFNFIKKKDNNNEYYTNNHDGLQYKIDLDTKKILKIHNKETFELNWSEFKNFHWDKIDEQQQQQQQKKNQIFFKNANNFLSIFTNYYKDIITIENIELKNKIENRIYINKYKAITIKNNFEQIIFQIIFDDSNIKIKDPEIKENYFYRINKLIRSESNKYEILITTDKTYKIIFKVVEKNSIIIPVIIKYVSEINNKRKLQKFQLFYNGSSWEWIEDNDENFNNTTPLIQIEQNSTTRTPTKFGSNLQQQRLEMEQQHRQAMQQQSQLAASAASSAVSSTTSSATLLPADLLKKQAATNMQQRQLTQQQRQQQQQQEQRSTNSNLIFKKFKELKVNEILKNRNISNIKAFKEQIIQNYSIALHNKNTTKNEELKSIFQNIINKIDEFKLKKIYSILKSKNVINLNNERTKKLFEELIKEYELLSIKKNDIQKYNNIKKFINKSRIGPRINAIIDLTGNNLSQLLNNPSSTTQPNVGQGFRKKFIHKLKSLTSGKTQNYNILPNNNQKTLFNRAKSRISGIGSYLKEKWEKVKPQIPTSSAKAKHYQQLLNNNEQ